MGRDMPGGSVIGRVLLLVAPTAQRLAVGQLVAQLRELSEWLDVVGTEVAAASIAAALAREPIPGEDVKPPPFVLERAALLTAPSFV
jgi:hypothetical protein